MVDRYKGKYRISSARLKNWDYGSNAPYFVTICTGNKISYFGSIQEGQMHLSYLGQLANKYWLEIENKFPFVVLDHFVVMPNHVHGIINISRDAIYRVSNGDENTDTIKDAINQDAIKDAIKDAINRVSTLQMDELAELREIIIQCCIRICLVLYTGIRVDALLK